MVAWDKVCTPKKLGGLGFRKTAAVNCAYQCKLAWKILEGQETLWTTVMSTKYLRGHQFLAASAKQVILWYGEVLLNVKILFNRAWFGLLGMDVTFPLERQLVRYYEHPRLVGLG